MLLFDFSIGDFIETNQICLPYVDGPCIKCPRETCLLQPLAFFKAIEEFIKKIIWEVIQASIVAHQSKKDGLIT